MTPAGVDVAIEQLERVLLAQQRTEVHAAETEHTDVDTRVA